MHTSGVDYMFYSAFPMQVCRPGLGAWCLTMAGLPKQIPLAVRKLRPPKVTVCRVFAAITAGTRLPDNFSMLHRRFYIIDRFPASFYDKHPSIR